MGLGGLNVDRSCQPAPHNVGKAREAAGGVQLAVHPVALRIPGLHAPALLLCTHIDPWHRCSPHSPLPLLDRPSPQCALLRGHHPGGAAMYIENWESFYQQAVDLYQNDPLKTRFVTKYRHCDGKLTLKVTDDTTVGASRGGAGGDRRGGAALSVAAAEGGSSGGRRTQGF